MHMNQSCVEYNNEPSSFVSPIPEPTFHDVGEILNFLDFLILLHWFPLENIKSKKYITVLSLLTNCISEKCHILIFIHLEIGGIDIFWWHESLLFFYSFHLVIGIHFVLQLALIYRQNANIDNHRYGFVNLLCFLHQETSQPQRVRVVSFRDWIFSLSL